MAKFKVGDKIVCVNPGHNVELELGEEYTVKYCGEQTQGSSYPAQVGIELAQAEWSVDRFELVKEPVTNGVDAEGKAIFFDLANLKSWMRVVTENKVEWIVAEKDGEPFLITLNSVEDMLGPNWVPVKLDDEWEVMEVYNEPCGYHAMLSVEKKGELIWKKAAPKTSEQLAQEAAVAARNKAIEDAVMALKMAQEKLDELKGM